MHLLFPFVSRAPGFGKTAVRFLALRWVSLRFTHPTRLSITVPNSPGVSQNPNGIQAASPGLRYSATLGKDAYPTPLYPERVTANDRPGRNPVGVDQVWVVVLRSRGTGVSPVFGMLRTSMCHTEDVLSMSFHGRDAHATKDADKDTGLLFRMVRVLRGLGKGMASLPVSSVGFASLYPPYASFPNHSQLARCLPESQRDSGC